MTETTTTARRLPGLPPRGQGMGDWYQTPGTTMRHCTRGCDGPFGQHEEIVAVLEYLPEQDEGRPGHLLSDHKHPGWRIKGWLAWWECPDCGDVWFQAVTARRVATWGKTLGGWIRR